MSDLMMALYERA